MNPMQDIKVPVEVDPNEDTEWNDILRSHGIIPEKPPSPTLELENALDEAIKKQHENRLENKELDELDELEDEEDEEFLNFYKNKRMNELKQFQSKLKFGQVFPITKSEYEKEVTNDSENQFVILHMSSESSLQSRLLSSIFTQLAKKFADVKFVDIPARRCVENYPEANTPTILIYRNKNVVRQYITLTELGGNDCNLKDLENVLIKFKIVDEFDKRLIINQEEDFDDRKLKFTKRSIRNDDDDDDDFYD
ncbi:phosducin-like protein 2 [[Candida] jaroonii]|uniref:Phosducin-like protein 2 n=1 Tax=[Candida] jaroonii TaxID=467808 RepID=A0ACA9Y2U3_9ASCO|nr:phosducin-like protein 2 [[Candida] jaroonii]